MSSRGSERVLGKVSLAKGEIAPKRVIALRELKRKERVRENEPLFQMAFFPFIEKNVVLGAQGNMWWRVNRECAVVFFCLFVFYLFFFF